MINIRKLAAVDMAWLGVRGHCSGICAWHYLAIHSRIAIASLWFSECNHLATHHGNLADCDCGKLYSLVYLFRVDRKSRNCERRRSTGNCKRETIWHPANNYSCPFGGSRYNNCSRTSPEEQEMIKREIESMDREIDQLVYELSPTGMVYGLSAEVPKCGDVR